jgi:hypothetical protein
VGIPTLVRVLLATRVFELCAYFVGINISKAELSIFRHGATKPAQRAGIYIILGRMKEEQ